MAVKIQSIMLDRAEGPSAECFARTVKSFDEARKLLRSWSRTSPKGGAYDKVDFEITWADGETYRGRYDMVHGDSGDLLGHVRQNLLFHGGQWHPPHMTREHYDELLDRYELDPQAPKRMDYLRFMKKYLPEE